MKKILIYLFLSITLLSCKKDLLVDDLAPLEGTFEWQYSYYVENIWLILSYTTEEHYRYPSDDGYSATVEFGGMNHITFYIDDEEVVQKPFRILKKESIDGKLHLELKVDVSKKDLDINDKIELIYYIDTLQIDKFPHSGYSGHDYGKNYFVRK